MEDNLCSKSLLLSLKMQVIQVCMRVCLHMKTPLFPWTEKKKISSENRLSAPLFSLKKI